MKPPHLNPPRLGTFSEAMERCHKRLARFEAVFWFLYITAISGLLAAIVRALKAL